jgi:hypothetical protein
MRAEVQTDLALDHARDRLRTKKRVRTLT